MRNRVGQSDGRGVQIAAHARASVVHRVCAFRDRTAVKRTAFTRRSRARGSSGTTEGVKFATGGRGRTSRTSRACASSMTAGGDRGARVGRCACPWEPPNFVVSSVAVDRDGTFMGTRRRHLASLTDGTARHGGRFQPLARLRAAEPPSHRRHRRRDSSRLRRCVPGARRLVRERTPRFFVRVTPFSRNLESPASALTAPLPPPCPTANPQARTSCPRSRPSPRARWRPRALPWLTAPASAARCTSRFANPDSTAGATRRSET